MGTASLNVKARSLQQGPPDPRLKHVAVLHQTVVAIVGDNHPMARKDKISLEELATQPLIFRARGSSTQRVIDRAFDQLGLSPEPLLIADTRDAVLEAANLRIGIGFIWDNGTSRVGNFGQVPIKQVTHRATEVAFALRDERNELADVFLSMAKHLMESRGKSRSLAMTQAEGPFSV
ncbi:LysR family transcriptional regulator substrate-binding protein [Mesorhizobium sp. A623]